MRAWKARLSSTERLGIRLNCWNTRPSRSRRSSARPASESAVTSASSSLISPLSAASSPAIRCSSVLLPEPDSPVSATRSPGATSRLTPRNTAISSPSHRLLVLQHELVDRYGRLEHLVIPGVLGMTKEVALGNEFEAGGL